MQFNIRIPLLCTGWIHWYLALSACVCSGEKSEWLVSYTRSVMCLARSAIFSTSSQSCRHKLQRWRLHHSLKTSTEHSQVRGSDARTVVVQCTAAHFFCPVNVFLLFGTFW